MDKTLLRIRRSPMLKKTRRVYNEIMPIADYKFPMKLLMLEQITQTNIFCSSNNLIVTYNYRNANNINEIEIQRKIVDKNYEAYYDSIVFDSTWEIRSMYRRAIDFDILEEHDHRIRGK